MRIVTLAMVAIGLFAGLASYAAQAIECPCCNVKVSGSMSEHLHKCKACNPGKKEVKKPEKR